MVDLVEFDAADLAVLVGALALVDVVGCVVVAVVLVALGTV